MICKRNGWNREKSGTEGDGFVEFSRENSKVVLSGEQVTGQMYICARPKRQYESIIIFKSDGKAFAVSGSSRIEVDGLECLFQ